MDRLNEKDDEFFYLIQNEKKYKVYVKEGEVNLGIDGCSEFFGLEDLKTLKRLSLDFYDDRYHKLSMPKNIESLFLSHSLINDSKFLSQFPNLIEIGLLESTINFDQISGLKKLKKLRLAHQNIKKIENLTTLTNLEAIDLYGNRISRIDGLDSLKKLKKLNLSFNMIERIENLENLENLEKLNLASNLIKKMENLDFLLTLRKLNLSNNKIQKLEGLNRLKKLESIRLSGNYFPFLTLNQEEALKLFASLDNLKLINDTIYPDSKEYPIYK